MASNHASRSKAVNVRIDETVARELLDKIDLAQKEDPAKQKRADQRYRFRRTCLIKIMQAGGANMTLKAPTRDLSRSGLAFLHHGFIHTGTSCDVLIVSSGRKAISAEGTVIRCEYLESGVHIVSVKFKQPIDVSSVCDSAVSHRVLLVDDDPHIRKLVRILTRDQNLELVEAVDGAAALDAVALHMFDIILMDIDMPVMNGIEALKKLRESGYTGCVVALTSMDSEGDQERLLGEGFDHYIPKPLNKEALRELRAKVDDDPIFSTFAEIDGMQALISQFVEELAKITYDIQKALVGEDRSELTRLSRGLKGKAGSFGFEQISEAASSVEKKCSASGDKEELGKSVNQLLKLCRLARKPG